MRKIILGCKSVCLGLFLCATLGASSAAAETIPEFRAEYEIQSNGQVLVTERIEYDFGNAYRHGIFRTLRKDHPQGASAWYKERYLDIEIESVLRNGDPAPYTVTNGRSELEVRIGDPDRTVTGQHEYTISYTVDGALSATVEGTEFYWNVTGAEWSVPLELVTASVLGSDTGLLAEVYSCYRGRSGDTQGCDAATATDTTRRFTAAELEPGEEVTVAVALTDKVALRSTERWSLLWLLLLSVFLWVIVLVIWIWRYRTQDDPDHPVVPQYEPFAEYLPMYTGVLFDGKLDPKDITAGILYLAEQGFLRITRTEKSVLWLFSTTDYELTLLRPLAEIPTRFLQDVMGLLFPDGATVSQTENLSALKQRQTKNQKVITRLNEAMKQDLQDAGFMTRTVTLHETLWLIAPGLVFAVLGWWWSWEAVSLFVIFVGFIAGLFLWQPRRTTQGYEAKLHIKGFREFLRVTDTERFKFHNAPEKNPQTFMEYLPYAIALGVEKEWAEVFSDITIPEPEWYQGGSTGNFSAVALTNDLGKFSSSFASSSGASASSGGGSAGGGAGGGGGGSW